MNRHEIRQSNNFYTVAQRISKSVISCISAENTDLTEISIFLFYTQEISLHLTRHSNNKYRTDLIIYNEAFAFSDSKAAPHNSFTIVEFKKPMRDDYQDYDGEKNPIEQTEKYIDNLLNKSVTGRNGRLVDVTDKTPFYIYIVCDITPSLEKILKNREFEKTPDGKGYFKVKSKYYAAYFEVLPFEKVLDDARKRNRILFEKLNIE